MYSVKGDSLLGSERRHRNGGPVALARRVGTDQFTEKRFSGDTEKEGAIFNHEILEMVEKCEVVFQRLPKPDSRIEYDRLCIDTTGSQGVEPLLEESRDFSDHIFVAR